MIPYTWTSSCQQPSEMSAFDDIWRLENGSAKNRMLLAVKIECWIRGYLFILYVVVKRSNQMGFESNLASFRNAFCIDWSGISFPCELSLKVIWEWSFFIFFIAISTHSSIQVVAMVHNVPKIDRLESWFFDDQSRTSFSHKFDRTEATEIKLNSLHPIRNVRL